MVNMRKLPLILALFVSAQVEARWMTLKEAGSVVEHYGIDFDVKKNGSSNTAVDYTVRVQAEDAKTSASVFAIDYNGQIEKVQILEAYTLNGKDKIPVEPSAIEDRDKGEAKDFDAMKVRSIVFPQVQIGSKLHVKYTINTAKPVMEGRWSNGQILGPSVFIEKLKIRVKSEMPIFSGLRDPRGLIRKSQKDKFNIEYTNAKTLPGWVHAEKDPYFLPSGFTYIWTSTHKEWEPFFEDLSQDYAKVLTAPLPHKLQSLVKSAKRKSNPKEQILFLMENMSKDFRYFGDWRRHNGGIVPRTLAEIEKSRYGDCKDLASVLVAMLRALKIDANVALVRRGENPWGHEPDYIYPEMSTFNHAIAQAKVGKDIYWLDATNSVSSLEPFPDISGRPAWILESPKGHFERLPETVPKAFAHVHDYEYKFKSQDDVSVRVNAQLNHMAGYRIASDLLMAPRSEVLTDTLEYFAEGQAVNTFRYIKEPTTGRQLGDMKMALEFDTGRVTFDAGKDQFFVIPDGFLTGAFYETDARESDMRLAETPFSFQGVRRLKNTKLMQQKPDPCKVESEWMNLERKIAVEGPDVVVYQSVELKRPFVAREEFRSAAFKKLQKATRKCFYRSGVLVEALSASRE